MVKNKDNIQTDIDKANELLGKEPKSNEGKSQREIELETLLGQAQDVIKRQNDKIGELQDINNKLFLGIGVSTDIKGDKTDEELQEEEEKKQQEENDKAWAESFESLKKEQEKETEFEKQKGVL